MLMQELHIQPSELKKLTERLKWWWYYLVIEKLIKENKEAKDLMDKNKGKNSDMMEFPDDFVSYSINREMVKELEKGELE